MSTTTMTMPVGSPMHSDIRESQVTTTEGNVAPPQYDEDAAATLVWNDYQRAKAYVESENTAWLLEWQETDILYQSPIPYRFERVQTGRPPRVPRFIVAKVTRTLARAVKRGIFAEQYPFFLRPGNRTSQENIDAWTYLIGTLLKRMKFKYHGGLQINAQTLFGTGLGKFGWQERERKKKTRRRKTPDETIRMPAGGDKQVPTTESDDFKDVVTPVKESYPFYEYRKLGTTLFDPKWCTPDCPEESAGYAIDIDFVNFADLQEMAQLSCYKETKSKEGKILSPGIPSEAVLKTFFFMEPDGNAPMGTQTEDNMSSTGSMVTHAAARNRQTSIDPLAKPLMLLERWDSRTVKTILCYEGRKLTIRNEEHDCESMCHTACTWWPIENSGYGMGTGRTIGPDQRINAGVINEALKMIAYPMNAPLMYDATQSENAPTQNVIARMGGFWGVRPGASGDIRKAVAFLEMPPVPADAWKFVEYSQADAEHLSGADKQMQEGVLNGKQGAARSSFGAQRVAAMSDQNIADPIDSFAEGVIVPLIEFLVRMVKTKMPISEIRQILSEKYSKEILKAIDFDQFLDPDFEVTVLAGQKLAAKQGIQTLIPFFLQIVQQPQLLQFLHGRGDTIDFATIMDLLLQVSELSQQPDIFRALTPRERVMLKQMNPGAQKLQATVASKQVEGKNKLDQIHAKGQVDLANKGAEIAMQHISDGIPLERAVGLAERSSDLETLRQGQPDVMEQ